MIDRCVSPYTGFYQRASASELQSVFASVKVSALLLSDGANAIATCSPACLQKQFPFHDLFFYFSLFTPVAMETHIRPVDGQVVFSWPQTLES